MLDLVDGLDDKLWEARLGHYRVGYWIGDNRWGFIDRSPDVHVDGIPIRSGICQGAMRAIGTAFGLDVLPGFNNPGYEWDDRYSEWCEAIQNNIERLLGVA